MIALHVSVQRQSVKNYGIELAICMLIQSFDLNIKYYHRKSVDAAFYLLLVFNRLNSRASVPGKLLPLGNMVRYEIVPHLFREVEIVKECADKLREFSSHLDSIRPKVG